MQAGVARGIVGPSILGDRSMTRGELAGRTGCHLETIRYYEQTGLMPDPPRSPSGHRRYADAHEHRLRFILRGRELGFTIAGENGGALPGR